MPSGREDHACHGRGGVGAWVGNPAHLESHAVLLMAVKMGGEQGFSHAGLLRSPPIAEGEGGRRSRSHGGSFSPCSPLMVLPARGVVIRKNAGCANASLSHNLTFCE